MIIQKDITMAGWYIAKFRHEGQMFFASGKSHLECLEGMFEKLKWAEIGNWNK